MNSSIEYVESGPYDYFINSTVIRAMFMVDLIVSASATPVLILFGILGNITTIIIMLSTSAGTTPTTRLYYCWIAVFDCITIATRDVFFTFLTDGMYLYLHSNDLLSPRKTGTPQWYFSYASSKVCCMAIVFIYVVAETIANVSVVSLIVERLLVLTYPFSAPRFFTPKKVSIILSVIFVCSASLSICTFFGATTIVKLWVLDWPLCGMAIEPIVARVETAQLLLLYFVPAVAYVIVTLWTIAILRKISSQSRKLTSNKAQNEVSKKELESLIIAAAMVAVNVLIFLPIGVTFLTLPIASFRNPVDKYMVAYGSATWQAFYPFAILPHALNFIIYIVKVKGFKENVVKLYKCKRI